MDRRIDRNKMLIVICVLILLLGLAGILYVTNMDAGSIVNVVQDDKVLYTVDLRSSEDRIITVEYEGRTNTIQVKDHDIRVLEADCPDQICVNMGWLGAGALPIVCLPNHLSIEYMETDDDLDAVIQ